MASQSDDPTISEIRATRHQISARFDHDPRRLVAYYLEKQQQHRDRLIGEIAGSDKKDLLVPPGGVGREGREDSPVNADNHE